MALLGEWLLAQRKQAGLEPAQLSEKTKINPRYLDALERGDLNSLPTPVHARAFALAYAKACDADEDEALESVTAAFDGLAGARAQPKDAVQDAPEATESGLKRRGGNSDAPWRLWVIVAVGVALCFFGLDRLVNRQKSRRAVDPAVAMQAASGQAGAAPLASSATAASTAAMAEPESASAEVEGEVLALRSRRPCWVVLQVDGKRLPTILLQPDVKELWRIKNKAVMLAGNIGAVRVWWRGENLGYFGELGERMNGVVFEAGQPWRKDSSQNLDLPPGVPSKAAQ